MARILLAEDDFAVRDFTYRALSMDGHDVIVAHEGQEALRCLTVPGDAFDLLLSDIRMPVIDGKTLSKIAFQNFPQLPILLMTGFATHDGEDYAPSVVGVLQKPFSLDGIQSAVRSALGGKALSSKLIAAKAVGGKANRGMPNRSAPSRKGRLAENVRSS